MKLVQVPEVFTVPKRLEENGTTILYRWQPVAHVIDEDLFIRVLIQLVKGIGKGNRTIQTSYNAQFLGKASKHLEIMNDKFELGLSKNDCIEMSWIESILYIGGYPENTPPEVLLERKTNIKDSFKAKSDFVKKPIPESGLEGLWKLFLEEDVPYSIWNPFGGMMGRISESEIPYPRRKVIMFMIQYLTSWLGDDMESGRKHFEWIRKEYEYMADYASKYPRQAYVNNRDLDLGIMRTTPVPATLAVPRIKRNSLQIILGNPRVTGSAKKVLVKEIELITLRSQAHLLHQLGHPYGCHVFSIYSMSRVY
ncbi:hypothetical protein LIER_41161 [Lithospermum erythrorhizon]|uniref:Uncharacterized protein n=1 Tax=Lithospermum erythrorhizon TaxID=34254 RepID=A0AAV3RAQ6_LITER